LTFEEIQIVGKPLVLATTAEVDALASRLWITLPSGYREYVTRLGEGTLGGSFVRIYPPWRIEKELAEWRRRINKYWFWDDGRELLLKERALECVIIGDTVNGDELTFHPSRPNRLFILPRDSGRIFDVGGDLLAAIEWVCTSGELVEPFDERNFEPYDSRAESEGAEAEGPALTPKVNRSTTSSSWRHGGQSGMRSSRLRGRSCASRLRRAPKRSSCTKGS